MKKMERSLVLIKPDALQRGLIGDIISRFEKKGFKLVALKMIQMDDEILKKWYPVCRGAIFSQNSQVYEVDTDSRHDLGGLQRRGSHQENH